MQADKKLQAESSKCNAVAQERIWKEAVHMETTAAKNWEGRWGFIAEYDLKGVPVEKKVLPEKVSYYTDSRLPHTQSGSVGCSLSSPHSRTMLQLERMGYHGKKRTDIHNNYQYS
ncbi:Uncharacterized protein C2orf50 [Geodia barretti]|uniref:Uncharacterized protein C2orf50 n=1 Tax=Geodia barretti TaxID=519541 RepID=A0AA35SM52_GEOBA|nr:Uncharacterized protein C2orf50 [Geodia barretti]